MLIYGDFARIMKNTEHFEICNFLSQTTSCSAGSPEKLVQKIWDESKKYLLRDSHSFVLKLRILQNTLIMRV